MPPNSRAKLAESGKSKLRLEDAPPPAKKAKLSSVAKPPAFSWKPSLSQPSTSSQQSTSSGGASQRAFAPRPTSDAKVIDLTMDDDDVDVEHTKASGAAKGKGPQKGTGDLDDRLWVDRYAPTTKEELVVNKHKVEDVRRWLQEAFSGQAIAKYRRFLVVSGPAGSAKTATLKVLSREMGFAINEWVPAHNAPTTSKEGNFDDYEGMMDKFEAFLRRAGNYASLQLAPLNTSKAGSFASSGTAPSPHTAAGQSVVVLEDLPNILHPSTRSRFHAALQRHIAALSIPIVVVISDTGVRGEAEEPGASASRWASSSTDDTVSSRTIIPPTLGAAHVTEIAFNPVAPTFMTSALKRTRERAGAQKLVTDVDLANIVTGAAGDMRAAVMALEFACTRLRTSAKRSKKATNSSVDIATVTRRENALVLFHLLGKVMYNKRKGDPAPSSATKREAAALQKLDTRLKPEPSLPEWLAKQEGRKTSRVDVDELYANSPIDASLFGLYVHQNYPPFCTDLDQCDALVDNLSWIDANGGDKWYEQNPYSFHLHALGTLHALPIPVPRHGQKFCKPAFFEIGQREHKAVAAVERVRTWIGEGAPFPASPWTRNTVALELGGVLRAKTVRAPKEHKLFSELVFDEGGQRAEEASERETGRDVNAMDEDDMLQQNVWDDDEIRGTILEDDDIEDW